jgi:NAD(P)H-dependent flavin oxidoreductase YrpB (nitropropane dioxygenase family)
LEAVQMDQTIRTRATDLLRIDHPVVLGGMGGGATPPDLVAAVSNAGGLGVMGVTGRRPAEVRALAGEIRERTGGPFGLNLLLFRASTEQVDAVLAEHPPVFSTAWPEARQDLPELFSRAHQAGSLVMHMVSTLPEAVAAEAAGADVIVAQGTEGGGHVGTMGTSVVVPMVARRVRVPVVAAGGLADGAGLVAALALGAEGILLGTRFLATDESPLHDAMKRAILDSDGHDTLITEITDIAAGNVWPGAYARVQRNRLIEDWIGREGELRRRRGEVQERIERAHRDGDVAYSVVYTGQTAGLIDSIQPAGRVVDAIVGEAAEIIRSRLVPKLGGIGG